MNISMLLHGYEISQTDLLLSGFIRICEDACEAPYNDIGYGRVVWCHWLMLLLVIIMSNQTAGWQLPVMCEAEPSLKRCSQFPFISVVADTTCTKTFFLENK